MKFRFTGAVLAVLCMGCLHAGAQNPPLPVNQPNYNKPKVFADLPERLAFRAADAQALLNLPVGAQVNALLAPGFSVKGAIVSKSNPADAAVRSVVIKSTGRANAVFTFTQIRQADGSFLYRGRMISKDAGDALELVKEGDVYLLRKRGYYDIVNE